MLTHEEEPCPTADEARSYMITYSKHRSVYALVEKLLTIV